MEKKRREGVIRVRQGRGDTRREGYKAARLEVDAGGGVEAEVLTRGELLVIELMRPNGHFRK